MLLVFRGKLKIPSNGSLESAFRLLDALAVGGNVVLQPLSDPYAWAFALLKKQNTQEQMFYHKTFLKKV